MKGLPVEVIYVLLFLGFIFLNYFVQKAARRRQEEQEAAAQAEMPAEPPAEDEEPLGTVWGRTPASAVAPAPGPATARIPRPAPPPMSVEPPASQRRHPVRALLKDKRDLRRAVILAMVLGPCRAQEPPEQR